jgi:type IV pilus assembly protein PilY1
MPSVAQITDISNAPLSSSSNLTVLPNLLFTLDDSGSMSLDYNPDSVGTSDNTDWAESFHCKRNSTGNNFCNRTDPPFYANEVNGMAYDPQKTYRPAVKYNGSSFGDQSPSSAQCDPYNGRSCYDMYQYLQGDLYSTANNPAGNWFGSSSNLDLTTKWPEVVYCLASGSDVNNLDQCRRNGWSNATDARHTGTTFRYTTAGWRTGYPEAAAVHEFWRPSSGSTVTVTTSAPHGYTCSTYPCTTPNSVAPGSPYPTLSTFAILPRTGTGSSGSGFDNSGSTVTITQVSSTNQFTYSRNSGQRLAYAEFDRVVAFRNGSGGCTSGAGGRCTVYVTAPSHGLIAGDKTQVYVSNANIACSNGATVTVLSSPAPTADTFAYSNSCASSDNVSTTGVHRRTSLYNVPKLRYGGPIVYTLAAVDYCKDDALTDCQTGNSGAYTIAAPVRYCQNPFDAYRLDTPTLRERTGVKNRCQRKYDEGRGYIYPRYGQFTRTDVASGQTYGGRPLRTDCPSRPNCEGNEELRNFANWFSYYRTRMLAMKTSAGLSFTPIDKRYRVGFITINPGNPVSSDQYLQIKEFDSSHKEGWYEMFYKQEPGGGTPLREALARAGRHFAGKTGGINSGMSEDPVQYSCQQNFLLLTTDGYWNGNAGQRVDGSAISNVDNNAALGRNPPIWDGGTPYNPNPSDSAFSSSNTLADTALYYWQTDLRPTGSMGALGTDVSQDNVPTSSRDSANWQHMVTFGLGLADGLMLWRSDYESATSGDYYKVLTGGGSCPWDNDQCNWPMPHRDNPSAIDDLWHAAVNGRGVYFNARDPSSLQDGLNGALNGLQQRNASSAAAATSTPTITTTDRTIFLSTYTTMQWNGEIVARLIDPGTGAILPGNLWSAQARLQSRVSTSSDSRQIYTFDATSSSRLKDFQYNRLTTTEKTWFDDKCTPLSNMTQCSLLDPSNDLPKANDGRNMVDFLRGHTGLEATIYRDRQFALGDTVNSIPLYVGRPRLAFNDAVTPNYLTWANSQSTRTPVLFTGANDGMLHAFNAGTGDELWAYVPRIVAQNLWKLAEKNYATKHMYYVDGSPVSMDVYDTGSGNWRTILVGGLNSGGRGYFALDITDPSSPIGLWEFCSDSTLCPVSDSDLGLSYGNPVITKRASDGKWVVLVTSGYNNVSPGDGKGYLYVLDAISGSVLGKIGTGAGGTCTSSCSPFTGPSGLSKIAAWADNYLVDNTTKWVYGGDLFGNVWKFDLTTSSPTVKRLGMALDGSGRPQPITTKPVLGQIQNLYQVVVIGTGRYLGTSDLTDPATQSPPSTTAWQQSLYGFKDTDSDRGDLRLSGLVNQPLVGLPGGTERATSGACTATACGNPVDWSSVTAGWYFDLNPGNTSPGERVNVDPQLALGTLLVIGNVPGASACAVGGDAWLYQIDFKTGGTVITSPNKTIARRMTGALGVGQTSYQLPGGALRNVTIRSDGTTPTPENTNTAPNALGSRRSSWREMTQ